MNEPEPSRLQKWLAVRAYLEYRLKEADDMIAQLSAEQPATSWRLQHLPGGDGRHGRGVLHRDGCGFDDGRGGVLDRDGAVAALGEASVEVCAGCRPEVGLRGPEKI